MYHDTHMADYVNKVMRKKMLVREMHIPYLFGKTVLKRREDDVDDNTDYHDLKKYYKNKTATNYSQFASERKVDFRGFSTDGALYSHLAEGFIATATQYYYSYMRNGIWTFYPNNAVDGKQGLIWSIHYSDENKLTPLFMQPIIDY